jgi:hypothetical protein
VEATTGGLRHCFTRVSRDACARGRTPQTDPRSPGRESSGSRPGGMRTPGGTLTIRIALMIRSRREPPRDIDEHGSHVCKYTVSPNARPSSATEMNFSHRQCPSLAAEYQLRKLQVPVEQYKRTPCKVSQEAPTARHGDTGKPRARSPDLSRVSGGRDREEPCLPTPLTLIALSFSWELILSSCTEPPGQARTMKPPKQGRSPTRLERRDAGAHRNDS